MANVSVQLTQAPAIYTTFSEYVVPDYWASGYVVSYDSPYVVTGGAVVAVTGVAAIAAVGDVNNNIVVTPVGVSALAQVHSVNVWSVVDDSQAIVWATVVTGDSAWSGIDDSQTAAWATVPSSSAVTWSQISQGAGVSWH